MHSLHKAQLALQRLAALSSPPDTIVRWLEMSLAPTPSLKELTALARNDPGITVEVLRRRPSSERNRKYALHVPNAVQGIGVEEMREAALRAEIRGRFEVLDATAGEVCTLHSRKHAVACATAAAEIARVTRYPEPEAAHAAGLLASIGSLAMWDLFESELAELRPRVVGQDVHRLLEVEREALGVDHEHLGIVLCEVWGLPFELHDGLATLYRSAEQIERLSPGTTDMQMIGITRAAWYTAHEAGFPLLSGLRVGEPPADVTRLFETVDLQSILEHVRSSVGAAAELAQPRVRDDREALRTMIGVNGELKTRLLRTEQRLRAEESVNSVLQYGIQRLGDGDPLPGVMFRAMESIGFRRICCLEVDLRAGKLEIALSAAASGHTRVAEKAWIPFPTDRAYIGSPAILSRNDGVYAHQLILELTGVSSAVVAPLQDVVKDKHRFLCADRGAAGHPPIPGEDRALGIIADQASLLIKFEQLTREKERMATLDPLTGAVTRRRMMDRLEFLMSQSERTRMPFSLLIMDLDHFKKFNDTMGHQTGDRLLQDLVGLLSAHVRKGDLLARYGGEEFEVLLPNCDLEGAAVVAEGLRLAVFDYGQDNRGTYQGMQVSISMGAAQWRAAETALALIGRADVALYEAKHAGRNRVQRAA